LGRFSRAELHRLVLERVCEASATTVWRWLHDAALKPWQQRSWIFPRDPNFAAKAGVVLDPLCAPVRGQGAASGRLRRLRGREVAVAGAGAPARDDPGRAEPSGAGRVRVPPRRHAGLPGGLGRPPRALFDRVEAKTGIEPFDRLVEQVMTTEPYASARRVFRIVDNGSSHAGRASIARMRAPWPNARVIHLPIHASWLNQIELFVSIVQRKALTPNDFGSLAELTERLLAFGAHYRTVARPFQWTFTRADLDALLARLAAREPHLRLAA
jgi:DDE superfamily endonuclease